jgi:hypothetical protein
MKGEKMIKTGEQIVVEFFNFSKGEAEEVRGEFLGMLFPEKGEPKIVVMENGVERKIGLDFANWVRSETPQKEYAPVVPITRVKNEAPKPTAPTTGAAA